MAVRKKNKFPPLRLGPKIRRRLEYKPMTISELTSSINKVEHYEYMMTYDIRNTIARMLYHDAIEKHRDNGKLYRKLKQPLS